MAFQLERFRIRNLFGYRTVDITFNDNRLILVGENGTGKTTVANLIYFFLTRQWGRMAQYQFDFVELVVRHRNKLMGDEIKIERDDVLAYESLSMPKTFFTNSGTIRRYYSKHGQSRFVLRRSSDDEEYERELTQRINKLEHAEEVLSDVISEQIVYLPTYRRIERELEHIFPDLDLDEFEHRRQRASSTQNDSEDYVELVEFGMQDVENTIDREMNRLTRSNRINDLAGTFLSDVIQRAYKNVDTADLFNLSEPEIDEMLRRVRDLLKDEDKADLKNDIEKFKDRQHIEDIEKVILQLLVRLLELHRRQEDNERAFMDFLTICNRYLRDKDLLFDNTEFAYDIRTTVADFQQNIDLSTLSSGEKQIVSLFSHLFLSGRDSYFVMIDEPELSLSVPWQRKFLPDIVDNERCQGLIAVTHSPFIYQNDLKPFARDIKEFWV